MTILALNRHTTEELQLEACLRGFGGNRAVKLASELHHRDLKATNHVDAPAEVAPGELDGVPLDGERLRARLKPLSWNVIVLEKS